MNNKVLLAISCLFLAGTALMAFGLKGSGKLSLTAMIEVIEGKRSLTNVFQPVAKETLPQINYPDVYFRYDLNDKNTYYSSLVDKGFSELYAQFVAAKSDDEIKRFIAAKNAHDSFHYQVKVFYDDEQRRHLSFYINKKRLNNHAVLNLFLSQFRYTELKALFSQNNMLHKADERHLQYLTAVLSFDERGSFVNLRRR